MSDSDSMTLDRSAAVALTSKIMVISVIVLFVVIVFVLLLHVYAKWFWWRIEEEDLTHIQQRPRRGRRFVFAPGQQLAGAAARRGLDPTVLQSLHAQVFQVKDFEEGLECAVCLCELEEGEKIRLLPKCNHGFHLDCIDLWFQSHTTCPICRNPVAADSSGVVSTETSIGQEVSFGSVEENFPTNVLFWGDENEVNSRTASSSVVEEGASSSSMAANDSMLVIDIPRQVMEELPCSSPSPGSELKSPMAVRLRSLRRLLSGADRKVNPSSQRNCADDDAMV